MRVRARQKMICVLCVVHHVMCTAGAICFLHGFYQMLGKDSALSAMHVNYQGEGRSKELERTCWCLRKLAAVLHRADRGHIVRAHVHTAAL